MIYYFFKKNGLEVEKLFCGRTNQDLDPDWSWCFDPDDIFLSEGLLYFRKTRLNCILYLLQQHGFMVEESWCWIDLPGVQTFDQAKTFGVKWSRPRTVEQLKSHNRQGWDNIPQFPDVYRMLRSSKHGPIPTFLRHIVAINQNVNFFLFWYVFFFYCE